MQCKDIGCSITRIKDLIRQTLWAAGAWGVVVGVSGGIDSAVAVTLAVQALGPERVIGVSLPAATNDPADHRDAEALCQSYGIEFLTVPLDDIVSAAFINPALTDDRLLRGNFIARVRMAVLYNIAASRNALVCGTSNRTEYLIGYSTKWGDGAADLQPLLHLWKKDVYAIAEDLDLPQAIITKTPSAGFWEGQSDEGELDISYAELDAVLMHLEVHGFTQETPRGEEIFSLIKKSSHKRHAPANLL